MKATTIPLAAALLLSCGPKTPPAPAAAPAPPPAAEPEPVAPAPAPRPSPNADFQAALTYADGASVSGHVVRVERGDDWYAERGWVDGPDLKLTVELERGTDARDAAWSEIASLDISYSGEDGIDCQFDSSFQPMMYMCVLRTGSTATLTDGSTWDVASRYVWRFGFDDGTERAFYVNKLPARAQDVPRPGMNEENPDMYPPLREQVLAEAAAGLTRVKITP